MIQLLLNEPSLPAHQCLLLRKVRVVKFVHLIFIRVRLHTYSSSATNISKHFSLVFDSAFNLEPNIHVI